MTTRPLIDENRILPISLKVLITITVAVVLSIVYVISNNITTNNRIDDHTGRIKVLEEQQEKQKNVLTYLQILMIRVADKLNVDTTNPLEKGDSIKNLNTDIYLPL